MARKVTLYIEDTDIKLLITKGNQVEKWASLLLEPSLVRDGVILDEDLVANSIKTLLELGGVTKKKVIVGLSGLNSIFRVISLPELPQALLPEAVENEAGRVIPVPLEQVYLSYQQLAAPKGETRLFLVAYPRNSTDTLIKTMYKAGLKPDTMDLAPLALARCVNAPRAIIINSWLTYLDIVIMTERMPRLIRSMSLPIEVTSVEEKLPAIAEELSRTVAFYNSSYPGEPVESSVPVLVCGDLSEAPDSWKSLVGKAGYPVSALLSPVQFPETFNPGKFMVNIGLALKGKQAKGEEVFSSIVDFNALPEIYRPAAFKLGRVITPVVIVVAVAALAYGGLLIQDVADQTSDLQSDIGELNSQMDKLSSDMILINKDIAEQTDAIAPLPDEVAQIESELQSVQTTKDVLDSQLTGLEQGLDKTNGDLREAVNLLPDNVTLLGIQHGGDMVTISGLAPGEDDIFAYARALRGGGRFSTVIVSSIVEVFQTGSEEGIKGFNFVFLLK